MVALLIVVAVIVVLILTFAWCALMLGSRDDDEHGRG